MSEWIRRRVLKIQKLEDELRRGPDRKIVEHAEADYQARCREEEKQYFLDLLKVFGDLGRGWVMESYGLNDHIAATDMATPRSMASNASTPSPENDQADELPGGDEWDVPEDVEDPTPLAPRSNTHLTEVAAGRKRRIARTDKYRQRKRPRYNDPRGSLTGDRTIEFNQVFQGGKARTKYRIARYPPQGGAWYILECREHEKRFPKDPIHGAAKHLDSPAHEHMGRGHKQAVRELGTLVLGCNEALAAKNNAIFDRASAKDAEKPGGSRRPNNGARKSCFRPPAVRNTANIMTVKPGDICATRWQEHKGLYPIYILPLGVCPRLGFTQSAIVQTKLVTQLPSCYEFDPKTDSEPRWAPDYEDGGARVKERLWPVMFFKDGRFPNVNEISFVPASHMRPYDKADSTIRYKDEVEDFLTRRDKPTPSPSVESRGSSPSKLSTVEIGLGAPSLTMIAAANSDHQDTPISDDAVPEDATPRQQHSRHPGIQRILEQASADFGEHAVVEEEHETDEHGDFRYDPRTGETGDEEEEEEERGSVVRSTYHFRDWRQRRRFYDGDTEESAAESEEEEEEEMRVDDGFDIYGDDTPRRSPPRHTRNRTTPQMRSSPNTTNLPVYDEEEDIYEDDTLRRPSTDRSGGTSNTPAPSARNVPNPQFPKFNEFWRRHSRERTTESDQQSSYSELLRVGLQMS
ncbi:hypothetical protein NW767_011739 [Fusarium falciforme]|nr:hypothetical protein NW767_011739 [Fusarium falciforme]